jgi:hypothetical protein
MLPAMTRWLVLICVLVSACGGSEKSTPVTPTPIGVSLPPGAPSDAAAKPDTRRITVTTVEIIGPDGARVTPDRLKVTPASSSYNMRVWIFCPPGLEGPQGSGWNAEILEYQIRKSDLATNTGGTLSGALRLEEGYTVIEAPLAMTSGPGQQRVTTEILRNYALIARNEFTATFSK